MREKSQILIGLTGGIATGKTTVANYLAGAYNLPILDADLYARESVKPGSPILSAILSRYGTTLQNASGQLNRQKLGNIVFSSPPERKWLESQIHPYVRQCFLSEIQVLTVPLAILVIPLLLEAKMTDLVDRVWVVSCPDRQQIDRLLRRDRLSLQQAKDRLNSQMPLSQKVAAADLVLDNASTLENLYQQIDVAMQKVI